MYKNETLFNAQSELSKEKDTNGPFACVAVMGFAVRNNVPVSVRTYAHIHTHTQRKYEIWSLHKSKR